MDSHLVSLLNPTSLEAEQFRTLRHLVEQMRGRSDVGMIAVSSPAPKDGKTLISINLAGALAQPPEAKVLLIDMDLRNPSVPHQLGLDSPVGSGLVDLILDGSRSLDTAIRNCPEYNFSVLPAGLCPTVPYEVLKSEALARICQEARRRYEYIIVDTPPLLPFPDCRLIEKWVDGFLVVVAAHRTPTKLVEEALNVVDAAKIRGLVFNFNDRSLSRYNYYYSRLKSSKPPGWLGRARERVHVTREF